MYVYYDAGIQQGCFYRFLCCPHFGKITSERVIYSEYPKLDTSFNRNVCLRVFDFLLYFWNKKVESMDYDLVLDVSVQQSCKFY